ncbi:hypothetical protein [Streptomyces sclerotialus]|uniref:hypothetical protein n=1 Tax=Streptomyces sclerotialus TaxID=1957 RepID=UPI000AACE229
MSDDNDDSGAGSSGSSGRGSMPDLRTLRRAMRWETPAVLLLLIVLAAVFS